MAESPGLDYGGIYVTTLELWEKQQTVVFSVYLGENEDGGTEQSKKGKREYKG